MSGGEVVNRGYAAIKAEAKRVGWPERFPNDLEQVDRGLCEQWHGPFAWILRESGTHFCTPGRRGAYWKGPAERFPLSVADAFGPDACLYYWWDGKRLRKLDSAGQLSDLLRRATDKASPALAWIGC